jgi:hypothetical protein
MLIIQTTTRIYVEAGRKPALRTEYIFLHDDSPACSLPFTIIGKRLSTPYCPPMASA